MTYLSYLIVQRQCSAIWPFFTPLTAHWLTPENLALMRLCDIWRVKRLMNPGSVMEWFDKEAEKDVDRNLRSCPPRIVLGNKDWRIEPVKNQQNHWELKPEIPEFPAGEDFGKWTIALIAHDGMKSRMVDFAIDNESELSLFGRILTTGTTGRLIADATRRLDKIFRYHSGPKGGDIEIATEILAGRCHAVIFFIDPLNPHPHIDDIRVVFAACMIRNDVRMFTNELHAREWMARVVRRHRIHP